MKISTTEGYRHIAPGRLPNMRTLIVPDPGYWLVDMDLSRADAQVVAWESGDAALKQKFREERIDPSKDVHSANAISLFGSLDYQKRQWAKIFCHGANYGATARTLARQCNITLQRAEAMLEQWFASHPGIKDWHNRTKHFLETTRTVKNPFGYRMFFFDRVETCFNEALAWVPQSTVGEVINRALCQICEDEMLEEDVNVLLQNHDSLLMQIRKGTLKQNLPIIRKNAEIIIPYDDPLVIPVGFKISDVSWGDCHEVTFNDSGDVILHESKTATRIIH